MLSLVLSIFSFVSLFALLAYGAFLFKTHRRIVGVVAILLTLCWWPFFEVHRPQLETTKITGTDTIRFDESKSGKSQDIRLIYTESNEFFNIDNLFWLKWDSGSLTNKAIQYNNKEVLVAYNGFRFTMGSIYPNILAINPNIVLMIWYCLSYVLFISPMLLMVYLIHRFKKKVNEDATST